MRSWAIPQHWRVLPLCVGVGGWVGTLLLHRAELEACLSLSFPGRYIENMTGD